MGLQMMYPHRMLQFKNWTTKLDVHVPKHALDNAEGGVVDLYKTKTLQDHRKARVRRTRSNFS